MVHTFLVCICGVYLKTWFLFLKGELSLLNSLSNASQVRSESNSMSAQVFRIACEKGLDVQNFQCAGCKASFEVNQMPW